MSDRGRQMARSGARVRNPSLKARESAENEEKMENGKNEIEENKKRNKKGRKELEGKGNYKEENCVDVWESQPLNIDPNDDSILLGDDEDEGDKSEKEEDKKDGLCSVCRTNQSNLDCDSCEKEYCFTCEEIDEKKKMQTGTTIST